MIYTLARLKHHRPRPPYQLGGMLLRAGGRASLIDAEDAVELEGELGDLRNGDWVTVRVIRTLAESVSFDQVKLVRRTSQKLWQAKPHAFEFSRFLQRVRSFFLDENFCEVHTPSLVACPGLEPSLKPFAIAGTENFLPTSPEIHLKKALACGLSDIFEIRSCFRAGEFSEHHASEFFMLEWYRAFSDLKQIAKDLQWLLDVVTGGKALLKETTWRELFLSELNFILTPKTQAAELRRLCIENQLHVSANDNFNDLFHRLVIDRLEPKFKAMGPLLVRDFPPSQAALAKLTDEGWADRFEFYWQGLEIANAFNEVTDPNEQIARWQEEQKERAHLGTEVLPIDLELVNLMRERGFPPTGGIALGLERLYMALHGIADIKELKLFD